MLTAVICVRLCARRRCVIEFEVFASVDRTFFCFVLVLLVLDFLFWCLVNDDARTNENTIFFLYFNVDETRPRQPLRGKINALDPSPAAAMTAQNIFLTLECSQKLILGFKTEIG